MTRAHEHIKITEEMEADIRNWLFNMKLSHYLSKEFEHRDICSDPFSNGLLLAELFGQLERLTVFKLIKAPKTIAESRANVQKMLCLIKQKRKDFPSRLLDSTSIENVLKRDKQTIYSILYQLKLAYPQPVALNRSNYSSVVSQQTRQD